MDHRSSRCDEQPPDRKHSETESRLTAIETHLDKIEELLAGVGQFNSRLDQVHATVQSALGFLIPETANGPANDPRPAREQPDNSAGSLRVIAHLSREGQGARLVAPMAWSDMWAVRLFVTGLLRGLARSGVPALGCRCWCEVWNLDENGELVDSAYLDPVTGAIERESDLFGPDDGA